MPIDQLEVIRRMKQSAQERCRQRVLTARSGVVGSGCREREIPAPQKELLKRWKSQHGL